MPYGATAKYRHEEIHSVPRGWKVRTVTVNPPRSQKHLVRVAFPPGRREKGSGVVVAVLHPKHENPNTCATRQKNPAELLLMGANPVRHRNSSPYDALSVNEKLAFGRLGLGRAQLQSESDIAKARHQVQECQHLRNRLPNPASAVGEEAEQAQELYEEFHETESTRYFVLNEPHMQSGDYTDLGEFLDIKVKPANGGPVQIISFEGADVRLVCDTSRRQLYLAGHGQDLDDASLRVFSDGAEDRLLLGAARSIAYRAVKWHAEVPDGARGKDQPYEHRFGEDRGSEPEVWYSRSMKRLLIGRASYHVEGAGIVN
jgi:hypothetical protein